jgi:metal-sulfur cluster biosynthetic enzyme
VSLPELLTVAATKESIIKLLYNVIDPELGINIVDLGLLRDVVVTADGGVEITMTLTTPACPLGPYIIDEIQQILEQVTTITVVDVEVIWNPAWDPERDMSEHAKQILGWHR